MSQAVIDFCEGLKTTLLSIEDRLGKAQTVLATGAARASEEAKKHVDEAAAELAKFKTHAGLMAEAIRAELPERGEAVKSKLTEFGQEAQVAMRHAVIFLAETASKGGGGAAGALHVGAEQAQKLAENLRRETAVTTPSADPSGGQTASS